MARFVRRRLIVQARQARSESHVEAHGRALPVHPGDWIVTDKNDSRGKHHVVSDVEFRSDYDPVGKRWPRFKHLPAKYRKKPMVIEATRVTKHGRIFERGTLLPVEPGDWIVKKPGFPRYALNDADFRRVYRPAR